MEMPNFGRNQVSEVIYHENEKADENDVTHLDTRRSKSNGIGRRAG